MCRVIGGMLVEIQINDQQRRHQWSQFLDVHKRSPATDSFSGLTRLGFAWHSSRQVLSC